MLAGPGAQRRLKIAGLSIFGPIRIEGTENEVRRGDVLHFEVSGIACSRFISSRAPLFPAVFELQMAAEGRDLGNAAAVPVSALPVK